MADGYYLSEQDRDDLRSLFNEWASERNNPSLRSRDENHDYPATGCYVAHIPVGGLPGLTPGTGTGSVHNAEPGQAYCDIYRVLENALGNPILFKVDELYQSVFNLSETAILQGKWALVVQDKFKDWYATGTVGGSSPTPLTVQTYEVGTGSASLEVIVNNCIDISVKIGPGQYLHLSQLLPGVALLQVQGQTVVVGDGTGTVSGSGTFSGDCNDDGSVSGTVSLDLEFVGGKIEVVELVGEVTP